MLLTWLAGVCLLMNGMVFDHNVVGPQAGADLSALLLREDAGQVQSLGEEGTVVLCLLSRPCAPCNRGIPWLKRLWRRHHQTVRFLGVWQEEEALLAAFNRTKALPFSFLMPHEAEQVGTLLRPRFNLALTLLLDKGKVLGAWAGDMDEDTQAALEAALP